MEIATHKAALTSEHVPCIFYTLNWLRNYTRASSFIYQAIEVVFNLKENPRPSNFINKVNLRTYELTLVDEP